METKYSPEPSSVVSKPYSWNGEMDRAVHASCGSPSTPRLDLLERSMRNGNAALVPETSHSSGTRDSCWSVAVAIADNGISTNRGNLSSRKAPSGADETHRYASRRVHNGEFLCPSPLRSDESPSPLGVWSHPWIRIRRIQLCLRAALPSHDDQRGPVICFDNNSRASSSVDVANTDSAVRCGAGCEYRASRSNRYRARTLAGWFWQIR